MGEVTADGDIIVGRVRPKNNPLIHRSEVGKPSFHNDMPPLPADYTFGAPLKKDPEGAGDVMLTWQCHTPPPSKLTYDFGRDFLSLNKQSVKSHCVNAKDVAGFRKDHDVRIKPKVTGKPPMQIPEKIMNDPNYSYGSRKEKVGEESLADLIQNRYEGEWVQEQVVRQQELERRAEKEKQRRRSPSRSVIYKKRSPSPAQLAAQVQHPKDFFTLKQFKNVQSRFLTPSPCPTFEGPVPPAQEKHE